MSILGVPEAHLCYETHGSGPLMIMVKEPHKVRRMGTHMANDELDNPGIRVPHPLSTCCPWLRDCFSIGGGQTLPSCRAA
jgi:hypothetical protein